MLDDQDEFENWAFCYAVDWVQQAAQRPKLERLRELLFAFQVRIDQTLIARGFLITRKDYEGGQNDQDFDAHWH